MDYLPQFGDNAPQDLSGIPANDTMAQMELQRKLKLAQALQQQTAPEGQMVSGHYVAPSWTQYAANALNKYVGSKQENEAMKQYGDYQQTKQQKYADLLGEQDPAKFQQALAQLPEYAPELVKNRLAGMVKDKTPIKGSAGDVFFDPTTHEQIFAVPNKPEKPQKPQFETFREGINQVTYQINPDGTRKKIASGSAFAPEKPQSDPYHFNDKPLAPLTNSKGWVLHTDAKGNKAYVSPDGKSFEEAK